MNIIISSPSLDPSVNVSGISSVTKFIFRNNTGHHYIHFELGRKDGERGGVFRICTVIRAYKNWKKLLARYPDALVHYNFPLEKPSVLRDPLFIRFVVKSGHRTVVHIHGGHFLSDSNFSFPFSLILKRVFNLDIPFIVLSEIESKIIKKNFGAKDVIVLPNSVEFCDTFSFVRNYPKPDTPLTLGYLGRIIEAKGMYFLVDACKQLRRDGVPFKLHIAGREEKGERILSKFKELGASFEYFGCIDGDEKRSFLSSLDVLVFPTFFPEGLPMSLLECMSYGVVPVVTNVGSISTVVVDGENGLFIRKQDAMSIVDVLTRLNSDRNLLDKLGKEARNTIISKFNPSRYIDNLNLIYNQNTYVHKGLNK